ncbi:MULTISPECIES: TNT domain-containing protein [Nocardiopsidaceae]|uniref:TNT domain-containing protein n=1 Tax=Streptomonospora nanhaiensis TaxID=1323731 RepID=A0ABY6YQ53_9ACTN|nr:TNT domain-containing protein [Streptomonospora nanhaiensis]WAE74425.1 TNT domain-containing protein [Streptomonospora nanhaiensis]
MKLSAVAGAALALLLVAPPAHADVLSPPGAPSAPQADCPVLDPPPTEEDLAAYLCGDRRLGPAELPSEGPVGSLVRSYDRFGDLTPTEFLDRWATPQGWDYPDHMGFVVVDGEPVNGLRRLREGRMLDRFGSPRGTFLAPAGAPYERRALPPDSLNTWPGGPEHNYNCYEVATGFTALVGPIAPHFEQPGGGEQVLAPAGELPEAQGDGYVPVSDLLEWGYLEQRPAEECAAPWRYALGA